MNQNVQSCIQAKFSVPEHTPYPKTPSLGVASRNADLFHPVIPATDSFRTVLDSVNTETFPLEKKMSVETAKSLLNSYGEPDSSMESSTESLRGFLESIDSSELTLEKRMSMDTLRWYLSSSDAVSLDKKTSMNFLRGLLEVPSFDKKHSMRGEGMDMERTKSIDLLRGMMGCHDSNLDRKMSLEVLKNCLVTKSSSTNSSKGMSSYDSFRFQRLARCLEDIEKDASQYDERETDDLGLGDLNTVIAVGDNLDSLLDEFPQGLIQSPTAAKMPTMQYQTPHQMPHPVAHQAPHQIQHQVAHSTAAEQLPALHHIMSNGMMQMLQVHSSDFYSNYNPCTAPPPWHFNSQQAGIMGPQGAMYQQQQFNQRQDNGKQPAASPAKICSVSGCSNMARTKGYCKAHGGGRRCKVEGCSKSAQTGHLCIAHGGGKPCKVDGCPKTAQSRGLCKQHGGGVRCKFPGCAKSCQSCGFCRGHGGGKRCESEGCKKWAQKNGMCAKHAQEKLNAAAR